MDHADRAFYDPLPGADHRVGLLLAQHGWAISGAYDSWVSRDSMMRTPAAATRAAISAESLPVISSALSRSDSSPSRRLV
jgi:hypothetical protein